MAYDTFVYRLLSLPATIEETAGQRKITILRNSKDKQLMMIVEKAIRKLNEQQIVGPKNKIMTFAVSEATVQ